MDSMFEEYFKEKKGLTAFKNQFGFVMYAIVDDSLYIRDFYVKPESRRQGVAYQMTDLLIAYAKEQGCTQVIADVEPRDLKSTESLKFILNYGFEVYDADENEILLKYEIGKAK
jgi:ribosomal protein S18 acetylase RimI-like enzyme